MQQKNINFGAKLTGKIAGGIYLNTNRGLMTIPANSVWVKIGNGDPTYDLFQLIPIQPVSNPTSNPPNDYFELLNPAGLTTDQALWYRYGKRASLYCSYSLTMFTTNPPSTIQTRISSLNPVSLITTNYAQSLRTIVTDGSRFSVEHVFPLVAPSNDQFYIEISKIGAGSITITVLEAYLSLYE